MGSAGGFIGVPFGAAAIGGSVQQGLQQNRAQRRGERAQTYAQNLAESRAAAEVKRGAMLERRQNRKKADTKALLDREREAALSGAGSTTLTGGAGVIQNNTLLGRASMLGGA